MENRYPVADNHDYIPEDDQRNGRKVFSYRFRFEDKFTEETGELVAKNLTEAMLILKVEYSVATLPVNLRIWEKETEDATDEGAETSKIKYLMHILDEHYKWLEGEGGHRADLHNLNLSGADLSKMNLRHANMAETDLSGANLEGANLASVNLMRANLSGANLKKTILAEADLSDADLRDVDLTGADLSGADLWRCNLKGAKIQPKALHKALSCR